MRSICVFCGSKYGDSPEFRAAAVEMGQLIAKEDLQLVYGGGHVGLMGALADAALAASGQVYGVMPEDLVKKEISHRGLTLLTVVHSMHERKAKMAELSDGFIALPGGYGTLEEFCEVLTWSMLGIHKKPCGLLNINGYFDPLLTFFDSAASHDFITKEHRDLVIVSNSPQDLLNKMKAYKHVARERYYERI